MMMAPYLTFPGSLPPPPDIVFPAELLFRVRTVEAAIASNRRGGCSPLMRRQYCIKMQLTTSLSPRSHRFAELSRDRTTAPQKSIVRSFAACEAREQMAIYNLIITRRQMIREDVVHRGSSCGGRSE